MTNCLDRFDHGFMVVIHTPELDGVTSLVGIKKRIRCLQPRRDRVIQQVNDYQREVFNGDLGTVTSIDLEEQEVVVQFADERTVSYDYADLSELSLAWAVTIHKSQGSEYPVVIVPLFMQHYLLLSRNLLYTGLTRAKQLAILVGPTKAIGFTVKRMLDRQRYTALADRLKHMERASPS